MAMRQNDEVNCYQVTDNSKRAQCKSRPPASPPPQILQASDQYDEITMATLGSFPRRYVSHQPLRMYEPT